MAIDYAKRKRELKDWLLEHDEKSQNWRDNLEQYNITCDILNIQENDNSK